MLFFPNFGPQNRLILISGPKNGQKGLIVAPPPRPTAREDYTPVACDANTNLTFLSQTDTYYVTLLQPGQVKTFGDINSYCKPLLTSK